MNGYQIIEEIKGRFKEEYRGRHHYVRSICDDEWEEEFLLEEEVAKAFKDSDKVKSFCYDMECFDGGPAYESTIIFFAWVDDEDNLCSTSVLTQCF